ncbi:transcription factor MYB4-like [Vicia villosa]|uniref:transcription factor MYB4-like n=1 Tax=Vicia villosa TaxID=3911 RepID=UPI00273C1882|nr:transcription factor MYB4-like [Vicia villosa]
MASHSLQQEKGNHGDDTKNIVLKKGKWLPEEDALLRDYVKKYGAKKWDKVREKIKLNRDGKSCRFRWLNSLKPSLKRDPFSEEEIQKLVRLYCELGPKWSQMVSQFPGRTDNELKNFINSKTRILKKSRKFSFSESINNIDDLIDSVMRGSSNQENNVSQKEEMALPRVEFDHQDITQDNYLDQFYYEENINFKPLSTLVDDSNMIYNNVGSSPLSNHIVPTLNDRFPTLPQSSYFQDKENINFEPLQKLDDNSYMLYNNVETTSLSMKQDLLTIPECSHIQNKEDTRSSFTSNNMLFNQDLPPLPQCWYNQDMDYQHPLFSSEEFFDQYPQNSILSSHEIQYEMLKPNSPRTNGYLEAMLYPPKIL